MQSIMGLYGGYRYGMFTSVIRIVRFSLGVKFEGEDILILVTAKKL